MDLENKKPGCGANRKPGLQHDSTVKNPTSKMWANQQPLRQFPLIFPEITAAAVEPPPLSFAEIERPSIKPVEEALRVLMKWSGADFDEIFSAKLGIPLKTYVLRWPDNTGCLVTVDNGCDIPDWHVVHAYVLARLALSSAINRACKKAYDQHSGQPGDEKRPRGMQ